VAHGYVYFIRASMTRYVKIGFSKNPAKRLKAIQTSSPDTVELLVAVPGTMQDERALHRAYADRRIEGEWFDPSPHMQNFINHASTMAQMLPSWDSMEPVVAKPEPPDGLTPSERAMGDNLPLVYRLASIRGASVYSRDSVVLRLANNAEGIDPSGPVMRYGLEAAIVQGKFGSAYVLGCCLKGMEQGNVRL